MIAAAERAHSGTAIIGSSKRAYGGGWFAALTPAAMCLVQGPSSRGTAHRG
jgi:hypothetical protein